MLRVALTGGIATGKSYVRRRFELLGVPTVDADGLARDVLAAATPGLAEVVARFGPSMLDADGVLDRARLGATVFADAQARCDLEDIVHPRVYAAIEVALEGYDAAGAPMALADVPLLFETNRAGAFDVVVVAICAVETQRARIQQRDGLSEEEARRRMAAQWPLAEKVRLADFVVSTDGDYADTDAQVQALYEELLSRSLRS